MSGKKIAIMSAGIGSITIGGLHSQLKPVEYRKDLTTDDLKKWAEDLLTSRTPGPIVTTWGYDFAVAYRKELGDDKFYALVTSKDYEIQCGEKTYSYIMDFVKWYELKDSQRNKPKLKKNGSNNLHKTGKV